MNEQAERARYADADVPERHCRHCGELLPYVARADKRYCGDACRRRALDERRRAERLREVAS